MVRFFIDVRGLVVAVCAALGVACECGYITHDNLETTIEDCFELGSDILKLSLQRRNLYGSGVVAPVIRPQCPCDSRGLFNAQGECLRRVQNSLSFDCQHL